MLITGRRPRRCSHRVATAAYRSHLALPFLPAPVADQVRDSLAVATQAGSAFVDGVRVALLAGAAAAVLAAALVLSLLHRRDPPTATEEDAVERELAAVS